MILYPHECAHGTRRAVDIAEYPRAHRYLEKHRRVLEERKYVLEAGRQWFEIWVPQDPSRWAAPKLVFRDITEQPTFWIDTEGGIVNGDCYWTKFLPGKNTTWLMLMLAVANSSFALKFYDTVFHNKLYSGRRRFMSQYVSRFPLPKLDRARDLLDLMPSVLAAVRSGDSPGLARLEQELDTLVWKAFGLTKEVAR